MMEFNPDPNKQATELLFSCKKNSPNHQSLFFNGTGKSKRTETFRTQNDLLRETTHKGEKRIGIIKYLLKF